MTDATILIAARDAEATIARAVRSARQQGAAAIVLVDDFSSDRTVELAEREAPELRVVRPPHHGQLGFTRQVGLDAAETRYAVWLDADDELLPGRVTRLVAALESSGADLAFDELELVDGASGRPLRHCPIPRFLDSPPFLYRQFERNYLPGVGQVAFRTDAARRVGYDRDLHGTEDSDFLLRALVAGLRATMVREVGYRMHTYPTSVSRQMRTQRAMYRQALLKHDYQDVRRAVKAAGASPAQTAWTLTSMAMFREEYHEARAFVTEVPGELDDVLDEACPLPQNWCVPFTMGTIDALTNRFDSARAHLERAERRLDSPEGSNNLGVVLARLGDSARARSLFERALRQRPDYADARANLTLAEPHRLTSHPLRRQPARADYHA